MFSTGFWVDALERAVATFAQALIALLGANALGFEQVDWLAALSVAGMAALLSLLKSVVATVADSETGASLGTAIPRSAVAATEEYHTHGAYEAGQAAPYSEGTPVDVKALDDSEHR
jgi:hypothetical protein